MNEADWRDALSPAISAATLSAEETTSFVSESITMHNEENKDDQFWTAASTPENRNLHQKGKASI